MPALSLPEGPHRALGWKRACALLALTIQGGHAPSPPHWLCSGPRSLSGLDFQVSALLILVVTSVNCLAKLLPACFWSNSHCSNTTLGYLLMLV